AIKPNAVNIRPATLIKSGINAANNFICYPFLKRHGCLIKKMFLNLKDFAGTSPHTPSLTCDAAGAGGRRKKRAPYHLPLQQSVFFWRGGKGYPKRFIKTIKPSLQIFLDVLPLPW
uniref:hypothetical protein n=1 Tax=Neisseria meningitidis TaxID=487 RepID=UPI001E2DC0B0